MIPGDLGEVLYEYFSSVHTREKNREDSAFGVGSMDSLEHVSSKTLEMLDVIGLCVFEGIWMDHFLIIIPYSTKYLISLYVSTVHCKIQKLNLLMKACKLEQHIPFTLMWQCS